MKIAFLKYYLLIIVLFAVSGVSYAQNPQDAYLNTEIKERKFAKEQWAKTIEGISYDEQKVKKEEDYDEDVSSSSSTSPSSRGSRRSYSSGGGGSGGSAFWAGFFKVLFIVIVIAAVALLVAHFMGAGTFVSPKNRKIIKSDSTITIDNVEEHIYESDLDRFIREATEQGNYALAIRLYYLAIIKELSLNRTILWKKDKTNKDYIQEMRKTNVFQSFREATRVFERVWYGEGDLEESDYQNIKPKFEALVNAAKRQEVSVNT